MILPGKRNCKLLAALSLLSVTDAGANGGIDTAIDEIQVTATRRGKAPSEVPAALTIVTVEEIRDNKLVTDALQSQAGVFLQQTTPGQGAAIVRGLKGSEVLHLVDGFRLNNAIFRNAPTPFLALVPVAAAERVEVLRGARASLYGSDAVGGVVQVVSRIPSFDSLQPDARGELFLGLDTAEQGRLLRGVFEYGTAKIAGLASAEYLQTGDRRVGGGGRLSPTAYEAGALRLAVVANQRADRQWLLDMQFAKQPETPRIDELVAGYGQTEPSSSEYLFRPNSRFFAHLRYSAQNAWADADWTVDAGWQRIVDDPLTRDFAASIRRLESNSSDLAGLTVSATRSLDTVSWIAGGEYYDDRISSQRFEEDLDTGAIQPVQSRYPDDSRVRQAALYVSADLSLADRHTVSAGIRYSDVTVKLPASGVVPEARVEINDTSFDVGWLYDVTADLQIVTNAGRGFRAPNVFDLGTLGVRPGNRYNVPNPDLQSEHVTQMDAGLRFLRDTLVAELVFYRVSYSDRIASVLTGEVTPEGRDVIQSQNVAEAEIRGIEASMTTQLSLRVTAGLLLNYSRGEQTEPDGREVPADRMPPLNGHLKIGFRPDDNFDLELSLHYADRQNRLSPRDLRDVRINPQGTAGWGTVNARAGWAPGNGWQLAVEMQNLLDHNYRLHGSGLDAIGRNLLLTVLRNW